MGFTQEQAKCGNSALSSSQAVKKVGMASRILMIFPSCQRDFQVPTENFRRSKSANLILNLNDLD